MNDTLLERKQPFPPGTGIAVKEYPLRVVNPPAVFRRQERFWKEVRNRITERNPALREVLERLY
jgi:hypothetical protein